MWPRGWVEIYLYSSMTAALEGGEWSAVGPGRTLPLGKTRYPFYSRLGELQDRSGWAENFVHTGIRSRTVQPVAQSLYGLSYPAHRKKFNFFIMAQQLLVGQGLLIIEASRPHSDTPHSVGLLWTSDLYLTINNAHN